MEWGRDTSYLSARGIASVALVSVLVVFFTSLSVGRLFLPGVDQGVQVNFYMLLVYSLSVRNPASLPYLVTVIVGIVLDILYMFPIGLHALLFCLVQWLASDQSRMLRAQPFLFLWFGYVISVCAVQGIIVGVLWLKTGVWDHSTAFLSTVLLTSLIFPMLYSLVSWGVVPVSVDQSGMQTNSRKFRIP